MAIGVFMVAGCGDEDPTLIQDTSPPSAVSDVAAGTVTEASITLH